MTAPVLKNRPKRVVRLLQDATPVAPRIVLPRIHAQYEGAEFMGIVGAHKGVPYDYMLLDTGLEPDADETWRRSMEWAQDLGFFLPYRREQLAMFSNRRDDQYKPRWYWSCEPYASDERFARCQHFGCCYQSYGREGDSYRARAIHRVRIA